MYQLFGEFAHRYDLHTPPNHYKHDHAFVIDTALQLKPGCCRLLDIGCGTGVLLEKALAAGIDVYGIDAAPEMVEVARRRLGDRRVKVARMQAISDEGAFHLVCALSWPIHYCQSQPELRDVIQRCRRALRVGGLLVLQVANEEQMNGSVNIDRENGPSGEPDDTLFVHRFRPLHDTEHGVLAEYVYASRAHRELLCERHQLRFASPPLIKQLLESLGFQEVRIIDVTSVSPFVVGKRALPPEPQCT